MIINAKVLRANIGKKIEWEEAHDRHRGTCLVRTGTIEDIQGKNLLVDGDYKWYPNLVNLKIFDPVKPKLSKKDPAG